MTARGFSLELSLEGPLPAELQILETLQRIERSISSRATADSPELLDRRQVAEWLGVSTRWVERHLRPTSQRRRRGRAWYARADVEEQMRLLRPRAPAPPPTRRRSKLAPLPMPGAEVQARIAAVEARLRDEPTETSDEPPIRSRKRGARAASRR